MKFDTIAARDLTHYANKALYILVDVRSPKEYAQGHIPGAINIPYEDFETRLPGFSKSKTYILYCDRGGTSLLAARRMYRQGFDVLSVTGGFRAYQRRY